MTSKVRMKVKVWSLILIVFMLGGVTGASLDRLYVLSQRGDRSGTTAPGSRWRQQMLENMKRDLELNDDQVSKIRVVFEDIRKEFQPKRFSECPGFKEMREKTNTRIRSILTPEQQERFDQINAKREAEKNQK
jgi:Spy/CpxP family protein refolding chaperone